MLSQRPPAPGRPLYRSKRRSPLRHPQTHRPQNRSQCGFTLAEMMIGVVIALFLLSGLILSFTATTKSSSDTLRAAKGAQDLRGAMMMMARDLRRAGYWANAASMTGSPATVNPFAALNTATAGCVLFAYDQNSNGTLDANESFGYRLKSGAIEARTAGATDDCAAAANTWEALTDAKVNTVNTLTFTLAELAAPVTGGGNMMVRQVTIDTAAQLARDAAVKQTFTETVRIRNDVFRP